jgi:hypothetical protein
MIKARGVLFNGVRRFGGGVIRLNPETPVKIMVNSAFAEAVMPDGNKVQFGNTSYQSKSYKEGQDGLLIEANVVFGGLEIVSGAK